MKIVSTAKKLILIVPQASAIKDINVELNEWGNDSENPSIVVYNATDKTYQGASADQNGIIIVNEVDPASANNALIMFEKGSSLECITNCLSADGFTDQYTSDTGFLAEKLSVAGMCLDDGSGIYIRSDRDLVTLSKEGDNYFVDHGEGKREIQDDILFRTYTMPDGSELDLLSF